MRSSWIFKPRFLVFLPVVLILLIAMACGEDATPTPTQVPATATAAPTATTTPPTATAAPTATTTPPTATPVPTGSVPKYGGVVPAMAFPGIHGWDPHKNGSAEDIVANGNIYNQLLEYDPLNPSEIIGDLAESWQSSTDGLTFTFNLRKGVKWTDGETFDADDAVFSLNRMINKETAGSRTGTFRNYLAEDPVEKVDQYTVRMKLAFPSGAFIRLIPISFNKIVPQHVLEAGADLNVFDKDAIGTGPFRRVDWKEGISMEFEKNPDYFMEGRPYFDGIQGFFMLDKGTEIAAYKTERILMGMSMQTQMDVEDVVRLEGDPEFAQKSDFYYISSSGHHIAMNMAKPPFDNEKVRRALFIGLDRDQLKDNFGSGKFTVGGVMGPLNPFALPEEELRTYPGYRLKDGKKDPADIAEAKSLLAEAGYADGFKTSMLVATIIFWPDAAQIVKQQFKDDFNIDIDIVLSDIGSAVAKIGAGEHEMIVFGSSGLIHDPDDRFSGLYVDEGRRRDYSTVGYEDPAVAQLFKQQTREQDFEKRKALNHEMQRLVLNGSYPTIEFAFRVWPVPVSKRIMTEKGHWVPPETQFTSLKHDHEWLEPE